MKLSIKPSDFVFIGIKGSVIALNRRTGQQAWATHLKGSGFVNVVLDDDVVLATCSGEVFCLEPMSGKGLWHNPLKGFGLGLATVATEKSSAVGNTMAQAEQQRRDEAAAAAAA